MGDAVFIVKQPPLLMKTYLCDSGRHVYLGSRVILRGMFSHIGLNLPESFPEVPGMGNQMKRVVCYLEWI